MPEALQITITGHRQKSAWDACEFPPVEQVRDSVWSIPVPFPDNPLRYTIAYLLAGTAGAVVVDPGWDSDEGWEALAAGLRTADLSPREVSGIVITHYHPDHHGMTGRLREVSGAWVAMGADERWRDHADDPDMALATDKAQLAHWGVPADRLEEMSFSTKAATVPSLLLPDLELDDGALLPLPGRRVRVVSTPGHTPGHICLVDEDHGLLFSGDHVLPRISPHISLEEGGLANPLDDYFDSLDILARYGNELEVCPAHEYRFRGIRDRVAFLAEHNRARSDEVRRVLESGQAGTVWEVAARLTWSRGWAALNGHSLRFAVAETASHVVYLRSLGLETGIETGWLADEAVPNGLPS
ncbi:MBL fold metallo-hydrolase [Arthrobacter sp. I2-34]|uniref:MBL fold metallo-hydrolase n=1 Tax=Arthrobacter hankyongi TaxID=2904801 RepID=A0ABS9L2L6_9MICC|nr:MBL fold metallo-hydrolase [Arthrobacter hankyongi]MCG2620889.1 MBL fold metallo-hydrolase [Arthrobacter hankyongi]